MSDVFLKMFFWGGVEVSLFLTVLLFMYTLHISTILGKASLCSTVANGSGRRVYNGS